MYYDLSVKFSFLYICAAVFLSDIIKIQLPKKKLPKKNNCVKILTADKNA